MNKKLFEKDLSDVEKFWSKTGRSFYTCPDTAFFRFISHLGVEWDNKVVLDLGFGQGHDLFEVCRRGAKGYGVDIDKRAVDGISVNESSYPKVKVGSIQNISNIFNVNFDLIYCLNTMYYLSEQELVLTLEKIYAAIKPGGFFVFQALTGDYNNKCIPPVLDNASIIKDKLNPIIFRDKSFYIELLRKSKFEICGIKSISETFRIDEEATRDSVYIAAKK